MQGIVKKYKHISKALKYCRLVGYCKMGEGLVYGLGGCKIGWFCTIVWLQKEGVCK